MSCLPGLQQSRAGTPHSTGQISAIANEGTTQDAGAEDLLRGQVRLRPEVLHGSVGAKKRGKYTSKRQGGGTYPPLCNRARSLMCSVAHHRPFLKFILCLRSVLSKGLRRYAP